MAATEANNTLERRREEAKNLASERTERMMAESMSRTSELVSAAADAVAKQIAWNASLFGYWAETFRGMQNAIARVVDVSTEAMDRLEQQEHQQQGQRRTA